MNEPSTSSEEQVIDSVGDLGRTVRHTRRQWHARQAETAGLAGVGVRFLSELENGKSSVRLGNVLRVLDMLGLELVVRPKRRNHG
ncbi:MAG TPA: helix-turn-helix domain-containing protein [Gammaproteobacteria bacterium]|nr:helix-turn-helix domain-containing protein [Gammaproteobacteria bacterium]